jgi:hypothetical protein
MADRYSGKEMQVVVDDRRRNRLARNVDKVSTGHAQHNQHAEHPLLIMMHARDLCQLLRVEREAGDGHDGLVGMWVRERALK